jgi:uncharacterized phiE125 gp8 family phage protein
MPLTLTITGAPIVEPLTLEEAKRFLRVDITRDDALIEALMVSAREEVELLTGRTILSTTYALRLECFPATGIIALPRPPLQSVTSIAYIDTAQVSQTLATTVYGVDSFSEPGRVYRKTGQTWPSVYDQLVPITITYVAGYTLATVPERMRTALKLLLNDSYEHREAHLDARTFCNEAVHRLLWGLSKVDFV